MILFRKKLDKRRNPPVIHNAYIVDASGSHAITKYNTVMLGIQQEIELLRQSKEHVSYTQTVVEFSGGGWPGDHVGYRYREESKMSHGTMKDLQDYSITPMGPYGSTPLYKTMGEVLQDLMSRKKRSQKVLVKIVVDGKDNASKNSRYNDLSTLRELMGDLRDKHGFTLAFIGPEAGILPIMSDLNMERGNVYIHNDTSRGVSQAMAAAAVATLFYAKQVINEYAAVGNEGFFSHADVQQQLVSEKIR